MRIIITGGGGFVGSRLVRRLVDHEVIALDSAGGSIPDLPNVTPVVGDICDPAVVTAAFSRGCDAIVHLATVPGGAAEQDPELAQRVNIDATMALAAAAAHASRRPRFVFASSIAVFGGALPETVNDATPLSPQLLYGAHKAMMEQWLATLSRRGELDAIALRVSGVVARPVGPSGMKSAFMSDVFHALSAGEAFVMPVSADARVWLTSVECAVDNFVQALTVNLASLSGERAVTLPALRVRIDKFVDEIARQAKASASLVTYAADDELEAAFGALPELSTPAAASLGFSDDGGLPELVARALKEIA